MATLHHFFYQSLDGHPITSNSLWIDGKTYGSHLWTGAVGNAIALIVKYSFVYTIGIAFTQVLWRELRIQPFTVEQVGSIMEWKSSPLALNSLPQIFKASWVFFPALLGLAMNLLPVIAPGALSIVSANFTIPLSCTISSVQLLSTDIAVSGIPTGFSLPPIRTLATRVLMIGSYIPPLSPCGICSYTVAFTAPTFKCNNITSSCNFTSAFSSADSGASVFWAATYTFNDTGLDLQAAWKIQWGPSNWPDFQNAIQCAAYNTTYNVNVTHDLTGSNIQVLDRADNNPLNASIITSGPYGSYSFLAVMDAVAIVLNGTVIYGPGYRFSGTNNFVGYGFGGLHDSLWSWNSDPAVAVPMLMENVSLSLLAGDVSVNAGFSSLVPVREICYYSALVYHYDRPRLLAPYGAGLIVMLWCLAMGYWARRRNGRWESLDFTRLADAMLSETMIRLVTVRRRLDKPLGTILQVSDKGAANGQFQVAS